MKRVRRVALAYSGGLDTSIIIPWLLENYDCEVVAVAADVGQEEETSGLAEKARRTGASDFHLLDLREEFAGDYLFPVLRSGAIYEREYLLGTAAARPLIARKQVEVALQTGCDALAHGCTGKGNDQVRFELAYQALAPELAVIAPWREWNITSREDAIDYARARGIPVAATKRDPYSRDRNLWHLSHEGGRLEDPAWEPEPSLFRLTVAPEDAPNEPERVSIEFESGRPVAVDGERLSPAQLIARLNAIGGRHGVGRCDIVENRLVGIKSRGVYETPGGTLLVTALRALESLTLDRDTAHEKERLALRYAELVYFGQWFTTLREGLDAFFESVCEPVTGRVTLKLYRGAATVCGRTSPCALYDAGLASFDMTGYTAADSAGFIRLFGLPHRGRKRLEPQRLETRSRTAAGRR
ncbi:MAG TPA: argininosuccinate synthase [Thermoanaerobaculia bacterium]|nr:argininosuccinate synthase [Thermoanaerobaculia bacterium]